jgi:hypothetical protein
MRNYEPARYFDAETRRYRWAVVCSRTWVYYFPARYGKKAAERLATRLNIGA